MLFDLGYPAKISTASEPSSDNEDDLKSAIHNIERDFDLVLITEYFDEGLVLMMREFCWTFDDIIYLKQNARTKSSKNKMSKKLSKQIALFHRTIYV